MQKITLELTVDQVNIILASLGRMPYVEVAAVIEEIRKTAQEQINPARVEQSTED